MNVKSNGGWVGEVGYGVGRYNLLLLAALSNEIKGEGGPNTTLHISP